MFPQKTPIEIHRVRSISNFFQHQNLFLLTPTFWRTPLSDHKKIIILWKPSSLILLYCYYLWLFELTVSKKEQQLAAMSIHLVTERKKMQRTLSIQPILKELRAGAAVTKAIPKKASFWDKVLSPRTVLKLCTFGIVPFSLYEIVKPYDFVNFFL